MEDLGVSDEGQAWRDVLDCLFDADGKIPSPAGAAAARLKSGTHLPVNFGVRFSCIAAIASW